MIKIELPSLAEQSTIVFEEAVKSAIAQLKANLEAPRLPGQTAVDESAYPREHLLRESEGWKAPEAVIVRAFFEHFQTHFPEYGTDRALALFLGLKSGDRRIRAFKEGSRSVPYGVWRHFLVMTGRVPQEIVPVLAYMG